MRKRICIIAVSILFLMGVGSIMILNSKLNSNYYYSKKLVEAIKEENMTTVQQIITEKPSCINTYPTLTSKWWHSVMGWRVNYPFIQACAMDNLDLIIFLLENGADPNCNDGHTPLSTTYRIKAENWYEVSLLLIQYGASLDYTTEYSGGKASILMDIVHTGYGESPEHDPEEEEKVMKSFRYALENCNHDNVNWMRVLQHSVTNDRIEIVKLLLDEKYCDVNDNSIGMTALMFAARDSTAEMIQLLLDYGADKNCKSNEGKTAYDYAVEFDRKDKIPLLEN